MPLDLSSLEETCSFLVPAYGISHDVAGAKFALEPGRYVGPHAGIEDTFGLLHRDEWYLQPRGTAQFLYGASAVFNDAIGPVGDRRIIRLREGHEPMPPQLANTCLMVQGLRTCVRRHQDRHDFVRGYAAWAKTSSPHEWLSSLTRGESVPGGILNKSVSFGRAGRGALYAPVGDGKAKILLLDFHVADRDTDAPDLLMVQASCTEVRLGDIPHKDPFGERLNDDWYALIKRAADGYGEEHGP